MSRRIARVLSGCVIGATGWMKPYRRAMTRALVSERLVQSVTIETTSGPIRFVTPTGRSMHDPWSLYNNEPETIRWLDSLPAGAVLWDIGANVGTYALYAARARGLRVLAFEPSASSHAVLVRNIEASGLGDRVNAYCLAFDATSRLDYLHMEATEAGHSMHAFATDQTVHGKVNPKFRQSVPGFAIDQFCELFAPLPPEHIKLDVDGNEPAILRGATATLSTHVQTVLVEIDNPDAGSAIRACLAPLGFTEDAEFTALPARRNVLFRREGSS